MKNILFYGTFILITMNTTLQGMEEKNTSSNNENEKNSTMQHVDSLLLPHMKHLSQQKENTHSKTENNDPKLNNKHMSLTLNSDLINQLKRLSKQKKPYISVNVELDSNCNSLEQNRELEENKQELVNNKEIENNNTDNNPENNEENLLFKNENHVIKNDTPRPLENNLVITFNQEAPNTQQELGQSKLIDLRNKDEIIHINSNTSNSNNTPRPKDKSTFKDENVIENNNSSNDVECCEVSEEHTQSNWRKCQLCCCDILAMFYCCFTTSRYIICCSK